MFQHTSVLHRHPFEYLTRTRFNFFVGIEYGADAFFIFEKTVSDISQLQSARGDLNVAVSQLSFSIEGHGSLNFNTNFSEKVSDLSVKFHGDFVLDTNPTTYEQAVRIYQEPPNLVTNENSVPLKVYLYPLSKIDPNKVLGIVRDIGQDLIARLLDVMQDIDETMEAVGDLVDSAEARTFRFFNTKVDKFANLLQQYKLRLQGQLAPLIISIRGSERQETELADFFWSLKLVLSTK